MSYETPTVEVLGGARRVIESTIPKSALRIDWSSVLSFGNPAYDLDD